MEEAAAITGYIVLALLVIAPLLRGVLYYGRLHRRIAEAGGRPEPAVGGPAETADGGVAVFAAGNTAGSGG